VNNDVELWVATCAAEKAILGLLKQGQVKGVRKLQAQVMPKINARYDRLGRVIRDRKTGGVKHETKPVHRLAFVLAYKNLERRNAIKIQRPPDIPFPMTDDKTLFSLKEAKT